MRQAQSGACVLLDDDDRLASGAPGRATTSIAASSRRWARAPRTAHRASSGAGCGSARGRSPASAARRPTASARTSCLDAHRSRGKMAPDVLDRQGLPHRQLMAAMTKVLRTTRQAAEDAPLLRHQLDAKTRDLIPASPTVARSWRRRSGWRRSVRPQHAHDGQASSMSCSCPRAVAAQQRDDLALVALASPRRTARTSRRNRC